MVNIDLTNKVALVTGGKNGIGEAIVSVLSEAGASVVSIDYAYPEPFQIVNRQIVQAQVDVADEHSIDTCIQNSLNHFGKIDILVNCAGISTMDVVVDSNLEDWDKVFSINSRGVYLFSKKVAKWMKDNTSTGRIIQISSQAGKNGYIGMGGYVASKHAVIGLTKTMAKELAPDNILVNAVCPGIVETEMKKRERIEGGIIRGMTADDIYAEDCSQVPLGRTANPHEVANVVLFLASPLASYMTGQAINVTGGMTMH